MYSDEEGVSVHDDPNNKMKTAEELEDSRKQKRIEKLDKRIKLLQKKVDKAAPKRPEKF